jgi:hypothetical protein
MSCALAARVIGCLRMSMEPASPSIVFRGFILGASWLSLFDCAFGRGMNIC